jgi:hypothetical protein
MIRRWFDRLGLAVGVSALVLAVVLAVAPGVASPVVDPETVERGPADAVATVVVLGTILIGVGIALRRQITAENWSDQVERQTREVPDTAVHGFDETLEQAVRAGNRESRAEVRDQLRATAVDVLAATRDESTETARAAVETGEWTDDPVVTAFLGDAEAVAVPLRWRLYEWIYQDRAFEQTVERTLTAVEEHTESGR